MDLIETIFVGISMIARVLVSALAGIGGGDPATMGLIILLLIAGGWLGVRNSERRRGRYDADQAYARRNEYRRKGY